jgi:hypothetical protein
VAITTHAARAMTSQRPCKEVADAEAQLLFPPTPLPCWLAPSVTTLLYSTIVSQTLRKVLRRGVFLDARGPRGGENYPSSCKAVDCCSGFSGPAREVFLSALLSSPESKCNRCV